MKKLLLDSDDLTAQEKATLGVKITPSTELADDYHQVANNLGPEIDTRKWQVSTSSGAHIPTNAGTLILRS